MTKFSILVAATFIPLVVLTRWTLALTPGGGPQGGEVIYLGWLMVALWLSLVSLISTVRVAPTGLFFFRYLAIPAGVFAALILFFWLVFYLLNHASLAEVPAGQSQAEIWIASILAGMLILANVLLLSKRR